MKKIISIVFSFLLVFTMFVGAPISQVMASTGDSGSEIQRKSKVVEAERVFDKQPPKYIYYNSGGFQGYIGLINYSKIGTLFFADYKGTVYDAPPYPIPASIYLED